jgi:hypothetical protein
MLLLFRKSVFHPVIYRKSVFPPINKQQQVSIRSFIMSKSVTKAPLPGRREDGSFIFEDFPEFLPNRSPQEILQAGSFGGTYFRPIKSSVCPEAKFGDEVWQELPAEWIKGLDPATRLSSKTYRAAVNKYKVKSGASLEEWETSGWIKPQDPYGWFQWYCRFFQGRRTEDDSRQVARWIACAGEFSGRWRNRLCKTVYLQGKKFDDPTASPVIRQTLLHWGYELTQEHYMKWGARQGAEKMSDAEEDGKKKKPKSKPKQPVPAASSSIEDYIKEPAGDGAKRIKLAAQKTITSGKEQDSKSKKKKL